jgi:hypothetical protein
MQLKVTRAFIVSAGVLLLAIATAGMLSNWTGAAMVSPREPVLMLRISTLFWIWGAMEVAVACVCLFGSSIRVQLMLIFWVGLNLAVYGWALADGSIRGLGGYLGGLAGSYGVSPATAALVLASTVCYLLLGSSITLLLCLAQSLATKHASDEEGFAKTTCRHCGGRVAFPAAGVGRQIPCPHCAATLTLQPAGASATAAVSKSCAV